jgi:phage-related tail protein
MKDEEKALFKEVIKLGKDFITDLKNAEKTELGAARVLITELETELASKNDSITKLLDLNSKASDQIVQLNGHIARLEEVIDQAYGEGVESLASRLCECFPNARNKIATEAAAIMQAGAFKDANAPATGRKA